MHPVERLKEEKEEGEEAEEARRAAHGTASEDGRVVPARRSSTSSPTRRSTTPAAGPLNPAPIRYDASTPDLGRVVNVLRAAERPGRPLPGRHPVWVTEFWWDSNPPNPGAPLSPYRRAGSSSRCTCSGRPARARRSTSRSATRPIGRTCTPGSSRGSSSSTARPSPPSPPSASRSSPSGSTSKCCAPGARLRRGASWYSAEAGGTLGRDQEDAGAQGRGFRHQASSAREAAVARDGGRQPKPRLETVGIRNTPRGRRWSPHGDDPRGHRGDPPHCRRDRRAAPEAPPPPKTPPPSHPAGDWLSRQLAWHRC